MESPIDRLVNWDSEEQIFQSVIRGAIGIFGEGEFSNRSFGVQSEFLRGGFSVGSARGVLGAKSGVGGVRNRVLAKVTSKNVRIGV